MTESYFNFGCFTGDCPHQTQAECDAAIRAEVATLESTVAQLTAENEILRRALVAHRSDLHNGSSRPCPTCYQSAHALGIADRVPNRCALADADAAALAQPRVPDSQFQPQRTMNIPDTVQGDAARATYEAVNAARGAIKEVAQNVKFLADIAKKKESTPAPNEDRGETIANLMLTYRHLEDASMRLGKALQAIDGGVSVYDKATTVGA